MSSAGRPGQRQEKDPAWSWARFGPARRGPGRGEADREEVEPGEQLLQAEGVAGGDVERHRVRRPPGWRRRWRARPPTHPGSSAPHGWRGSAASRGRRRGSRRPSGPTCRRWRATGAASPCAGRPAPRTSPRSWCSVRRSARRAPDWSAFRKKFRSPRDRLGPEWDAALGPGRRAAMRGRGGARGEIQRSGDDDGGTQHQHPWPQAQRPARPGLENVHGLRSLKTSPTRRLQRTGPVAASGVSRDGTSEPAMRRKQPLFQLRARPETGRARDRNVTTPLAPAQEGPGPIEAPLTLR